MNREHKQISFIFIMENLENQTTKAACGTTKDRFGGKHLRERHETHKKSLVMLFRAI